MSADTRDYRLDPQAFAHQRTRMILRGTIAAIVVFGFVAAIHYNQRETQNAFSLIFSGIIGLAAMIYGFAIAIQRAHQSWNSFTIRLNEDGEILRSCAGLAEMRIASNEITQIEEVPQTGLTIRTKDPVRWIFVSASLIDYDDFKNRLQSIQTVKRKNASTFTYLKFIGMGIVSLLPMYFAVASTDHRLALAGCIGVIGMLLYCRNRMLKEPYVDDRIKKNMWAMYMVMFSMFLNAVFRIYNLLG